jgi:uncharacterized membrane protein
VTFPEQPDTAFVQTLFARHGTACRGARPTLMAVAPKGTMSDTPRQIDARAALIHQQVAVLRLMPPGNLTRMSEARAAVARWHAARPSAP